MVIYMCIPGHIIPSGGTSYLLCQEHKNVRYEFDDIYEPDGKRKKVDHKSIIERSKINEHRN